MVRIHPYEDSTIESRDDTAPFDLETYDGWTASAAALLQGKPDWTVLTEDDALATLSLPAVNSKAVHSGSL
jgi:hypothetical protein